MRTTIYRFRLPRAFAAAIVCFSHASAQQGGPASDQLAKVDGLFSAELAKQNFASVSGGIIYGGQLVWTNSYGLADIGNNVAATVDTVYNIGSMGKQFTALMLLQLIDRGVVHLSDPVEMYVPEVKQIPNAFPNASPMTLVELATHTSGLTPEGTEPNTPSGTRAQWEQLLISVFPQVKFYYEPGTHYAYSNVGYAVLGLALERAAGQKYLDYLPAQIFSPLGMTHTGYDLTADMAAHVAKGYSLQNGAPVVAGDPTQQNLGRPYLTPAGGEYSTVGDMAKFIALEMGQGPESVLPSSRIRDNLTRAGSTNGDLSFGYGVGFGVSRSGTSVMLGHDGAVTFGFNSGGYIEQTGGVGMIFLRNAVPSGGAGFGPSFPFSVLNAAVPACPVPSVAAVTNGSYSLTVSAIDTLVVWGSGFTSWGLNVLNVSDAGGNSVAQYSERNGLYFWDQSQDQINASLAGQLKPENYQLKITNACGGQSAAPFPFTIH